MSDYIPIDERLHARGERVPSPEPKRTIWDVDVSFSELVFWFVKSLLAYLFVALVFALIAFAFWACIAGVVMKAAPHLK